MIYLRKPTELDEGAIADFLHEFASAGEATIPGSGGMARFEFHEWLRYGRDNEQEVSVRAGLVPATQFLSVRETDGRIVGCTVIRHRLNEQLLRFGGHIGYAIRPSERLKGYGAEQLRRALEECRRMGIYRALVTCNLQNLASAGVMLRCGGVEDDPDTEENGQVLRRFWFAC